MKDADAALDHLDMRALRLLGLLIETASVTRTAEALGLTQPAVSRALGQLRAVLDDPIIVRTSGGYALTPRALALAPLVQEARQAMRRVFAPAAFDPSSANGVVRVATTDYGAAVVLSRLAQRLASEAPGLRLHALPWSADTLGQLETGELDLALYADGDLPGDFLCRDLFRDTYACILRQEHPVLAERDPRGRLPVGALVRWTQAQMIYPDGRRFAADDVLADAFGVSSHPGSVAFRTTYFLAGPLAVSKTDHVMCLPRRIAELTVKLGGVELVELAEEAGFTYRVIWHKRTQADAMLAWMRTTIVEVSRRLDE